MHELSAFEQRLAIALEVSAGGRRPVDAAAIARRAVGARPVRRSRTESRTVLRLAFVAAIVGAVIAGGMLVGALLEQSSVPPSPPPSRPVTSAEPTTTADVMASTFSCAEAQAAAARTTATWTAGPAPASPGASESGWIAVWGGEEVPELYLIDPVSGDTCLLARFETYMNTPGVATPEGPLGWVPPRGPLAWSPDGKALAFVVVGQDNAVHDLYVWTEAGLAGPLVSRDGTFAGPGRPSWSPDGSLLAVPDLSNSHVPQTTNVWILSRSGEPARAIASGCVCHLGPVTWSASGQSIAATTREGPGGDEDGIVAGSADGDRLQAVPILADPAQSTFTEQVFGFVDDRTLLLANPSPQRLTGHRIDGGTDRDLGPTRVTNVMTENGPLSLAPDRSAWLFSPWPTFGFGILEISDGATRTVEAGSADIYGWAPNGRAVGYVNEHQGADQGIWVAGRDGTGARRVAAGPYVLEGAFAWQPVWPDR